ncbi:DUF7144 family membrane protein [Nonomuraea typhae]|uniref:DUF7144 family membrane protein n=1 Tax=Nonomuraea typhae TaxID=2603600 RepID=UPI0012F731CE|nr:hypothetical protein [Nonomuraea typhae]
MATASTPHGPAFRPQSSWLTFAGMLGVVLGVFNAIEGLIALFREDYFVTPGGRLLVFDYNTWGWIWLALGILQLAAGAGILAGQTWARIVGIILAGLAMIGQFAFVAAYPIWSVIGIALSVVIIYGLIAAPRDATG